MIILLMLLSLLVIGLYTTAVCIKVKGVPNSISATFYALEHKWWFRFTMWMTPLLLMPAILEVSKDNTEFLAFLALVGMFMVGSAPDYENDPFQRKVHMTGAVICILFSQLWVGFNCWIVLLPLWTTYLMYTGSNMIIKEVSSLRDKFMETNPMFWIEICSLTTIFITMIILL